MADDTPGADQTAAGAGAAGTDQTPQLSLRTQYTKDLSFENPRAPHSISPSQEAPNGDVQIKVSSQELGDDLHEIMLEFQITASREGDVVFIVELAYGGVFTVRGFDAKTQPLALWVECPRLLFPFARRVIADVVRDGGFAPLMLGPIDFHRMYQQRLAEAAAEAEAAQA